MVSQHNFLRIMGDPVEFPSHEDWEKNGPSLEEILRRCAQDGEDDNGTVAEDSDIDEDDEDEKIAAELFGDGEYALNVDDIKQEDCNGEELQHILALCDMQHDDALKEPSGVASVAVDAPGRSESSNAVYIASSPDAPSKNATRGKTSRRLQRQLSDHKKEKIQKKREDEKKKRDVNKRRKANAPSDDMSEVDRHTTQANVDEFFGTTATPQQSVSITLNAFDSQIFEVLRTKREKGDHQLDEAQKKFLISELRSRQGDVNSPPGVVLTNEIMHKGLSMYPPALKIFDDVDEIFYFGVVKRFYNKWSLEATKLAESSAR